MQCLCTLAITLVTVSRATGGIRGYKKAELAGSAGHSNSSNVKFMDLEYFTRSEVDELLVENAADDQRIHSLEQVLRPAFQALPKSSGLLTQHAVRYVLHRYFLQSHGWLVKGLEPEGAYQKAPEGVKKDWQSWVPSYLLQHFDIEQGVSLRDLAEMIAIIEDLVRKESHRQMAKVYEALGFSMTDPLPREDADLAMDMYLIIVLTARNITMAEPTKNRLRLQAFQTRYHGYADMHEWLRDLGQRYFEDSPEEGLSFSTMSKAAEAFGNEFPQFNDKECHELKTTLMKMEGGSRKPGRIPLSDFYNSSTYRHWNFTESPDYLRDLGALDESDVHRKYVILANYISSFNNCVRADSLYAICCRSPCERLMNVLEEKVAAPSADATLLASIVANLSTETVPARGTLDPKLMDRLEDIARQSESGSVPLHGRLFAQWMHHVFPRECPYPHEAGTTNPQTPDEWMKTNGRSTQVSAQQIEQIARDSCPADKKEGLPRHCDMENAELPWSNREDRAELLSSLHGPRTQLSGHTFFGREEQLGDSSEDSVPLLTLLSFVALPAMVLSAYLLDHMLGRNRQLQRRCYLSLVSALAFIWATVLCLMFHIVDMKAATGAGLVFLLWRLLVSHWIPVSGGKLIDSAV